MNTEIKRNLKISYYEDLSIDRNYVFSRIYKRYIQNYSEFSFKYDFLQKCQDLARWGVAQSLLETGYYKKIILYIYKDKKIKSKNLFNIKYGSYDVFFKDYYRIYDKNCSSVEDYAQLMNKQIYRQYIEKYFKDEFTFEQAMKRVSLVYAEDTKYFEKVKTIYDTLTNLNFVNVESCDIKILKISEVIK